MKIKVPEYRPPVGLQIDRAAFQNEIEREKRARIGIDAAGDFHRKKNIYTCDVCFGHIVTVDIDAGVTPFMIGCKCGNGCKGMMQSSMYRVFDQTMKADHEWYRPAGLTGLTAAETDHVEKGGLLLRKAAS